MRLWFSGRFLLLYHTSQYMPLRKGPSVNYRFKAVRITPQTRQKNAQKSKMTFFLGTNYVYIVKNWQQMARWKKWIDLILFKIKWCCYNCATLSLLIWKQQDTSLLLFLIYIHFITHSILYLTYQGFLSQWVQVLKIPAKIKRPFSFPDKRFHPKQNITFTFQKSSMVERCLKVEWSPGDRGVSRKSWDMTLV